MTDLALKDLLLAAFRRWWIILLCIIVSGGAAALLSMFYMTPVYETSTSLYVGKSSNNNQSIAEGLDLGSELVLDYQEIAKSKLVSSEVIKNLGLKDVTSEMMSEMINVEQKNNTRIIIISIKDNDPERAMEITNKAAEVFSQQISKIMQIENVQVIDKAELPIKPISPRKAVNTVVGIIFGGIIGIGIIILIEYRDNTIKTPEDIQKHIGLPVIGAIPVFDKAARRT